MFKDLADMADDCDDCDDCEDDVDAEHVQTVRPSDRSLFKNQFVLFSFIFQIVFSNKYG